MEMDSLFCVQYVFGKGGGQGGKLYQRLLHSIQ